MTTAEQIQRQSPLRVVMLQGEDHWPGSPHPDTRLDRRHDRVGRCRRLDRLTRRATLRLQHEVVGQGQAYPTGHGADLMFAISVERGVTRTRASRGFVNADPLFCHAVPDNQAAAGKRACALGQRARTRLCDVAAIGSRGEDRQHKPVGVRLVSQDVCQGKPDGDRPRSLGRRPRQGRSPSRPPPAPGTSCCGSPPPAS